MERRDFLAIGGSALLAGYPRVQARQTTAGSGVKFLYSGLFGFAAYNKRLKVLFVDADKAGHSGSVHSPMLMMRLDDYEPKPVKDTGEEYKDAIPRPQVLMFGGETVAVWGLAGRVVWCDRVQSSYDGDASPDLTITDRHNFINLGDILKSSGGPIKTPVKNWHRLYTHILMTRGEAKPESIDPNVCYWYVEDPTEADKKRYATQLSVAHPAPDGKPYLDLLIAKRSSANSEAPMNVAPYRLRIKCPTGWPQVTMVNAPLAVQTSSAHFKTFFNIVSKKEVSLEWGECPRMPKLAAPDIAYEHPFVGCVPAEMPQ